MVWSRTNFYARLIRTTGDPGPCCVLNVGFLQLNTDHYGWFWCSLTDATAVTRFPARLAIDAAWREALECIVVRLTSCMPTLMAETLTPAQIEEDLVAIDQLLEQHPWEES